MALTPKFCSQCGQPVVARVVEDRRRHVCASCGTIFYRNPLPVAASLVLNERREALLVRRREEPHRGMWCLPIGFAELDETIQEAALRELLEETGVSGRVVRLLCADSHQGSFYGDLLIVTFEVEAIGGLPRPGDDAEEVAFFPLAEAPPLAFHSNVGLLACLEAHRDEWAIQDSFQQLNSEPGHGLLSDSMPELLGLRGEEISRLWLSELRSNPNTLAYRRLDAAEVLEWARYALSHLREWLETGHASQSLVEFFSKLGREQRRMGFELYEVLTSLNLLHKYLWLFVRGRDVWAKPIDVYRVLEFDRRVGAFFDTVMFHATLGFEEGWAPAGLQ